MTPLDLLSLFLSWFPVAFVLLFLAYLAVVALGEGADDLVGFDW